MNERKLRSKIRRLIKEEEEEEEVLQGEEHDEEEDVEERVGVENAESGNYYNVTRSHALNNPQKYNKIRERALRRVVRKRIQEELSREKKSLNEGVQDVKVLKDFMMEFNEAGAANFDENHVRKVADHIGARPDDEVVVEQLRMRTTKALLQPHNLETADMAESGDMLILTWDEPVDGLPQTGVAAWLGTNNGKLSFFVYSKKNAR